MVPKVYIWPLIADLRDALPEEAWALLSHSIATLGYAELVSFTLAATPSNECSSVSEVVDIDTERLTSLTKELNLSMGSFGKQITDPSAQSYGTVNLSNPLGPGLEPAPVSPYRNSVAFSLLSGTIKAVYGAHRGDAKPDGT